jgi:hypothetical protein
LALGLYGLWWGYVICFLYAKEYDNNAAGAWASMGVAAITMVIVFAYAAGFAIAAFRDRLNRARHLWAMLLVFIPILAVTAFEFLR